MLTWLLVAFAHDPLTASITSMEASIRWPDATAEDVSKRGAEQQRLYRQLRNDPDRYEAVLAELGPVTREIVTSNLAAGVSASHTVSNLTRTVPAWDIVVPEPVDVLLAHYHAAEAEFGVPWELLAAIHLVETRMGRLRGTSWAGARGPMQFIPATWARYGKGDIDSSRDAIFAAGRYLSAMGSPERNEKAVWHYNQSKAYVASVLGYANVMRKNPLAYRGFHGWQVYYRTRSGIVRLPEGYHRDDVMEVRAWCKTTPEHCPTSLGGTGW